MARARVTESMVVVVETRRRPAEAVTEAEVVASTR
jgi:hypothetical protein